MTTKNVSKPATITIVHVIPGQPATVMRVKNDLTTFQALIGGGDIELVTLSGLALKGLHVYCSGDGKYLRLEENFSLRPVNGYQNMVLGCAIISKIDKDGEEIGLSEHDTEWASGFINAYRRNEKTLT
jgi:hypothetical protein